MQPFFLPWWVQRPAPLSAFVLPENPAAKGKPKPGQYRPAAATFREASENELPKWTTFSGRKE
jgi:hypothetical protein